MVEHLPEFVERAYLNLDFERQSLLVQVLVATLDGIDDAPCEVNMVVLEQNHVEEADTVVAAPANLDRLFFEHTHTRRGLTGIQHTSLGTLETLHIPVRHGSNATHALHDVEHEAFRLEQ